MASAIGSRQSLTDYIDQKYGAPGSTLLSIPRRSPELIPPPPPENKYLAFGRQSALLGWGTMQRLSISLVQTFDTATRKTNEGLQNALKMTGSEYELAEPMQFAPAFQQMSRQSTAAVRDALGANAQNDRDFGFGLTADEFGNQVVGRAMSMYMTRGIDAALGENKWMKGAKTADKIAETGGALADMNHAVGKIGDRLVELRQPPKPTDWDDCLRDDKVLGPLVDLLDATVKVADNAISAGRSGRKALARGARSEASGPLKDRFSGKNGRLQVAGESVETTVALQRRYRILGMLRAQMGTPRLRQAMRLLKAGAASGKEADRPDRATVGHPTPPKSSPLADARQAFGKIIGLTLKASDDGPETVLENPSLYAEAAEILVAALTIYAAANESGYVAKGVTERANLYRDGAKQLRGTARDYETTRGVQGGTSRVMPRGGEVLRQGRAEALREPGGAGAGMGLRLQRRINDPDDGKTFTFYPGNDPATERGERRLDDGYALLSSDNDPRAKVFVTGVRTSFRSFAHSAQRLANIDNRPVIGVYNASDVVYDEKTDKPTTKDDLIGGIGDFLQSGGDKLYGISRNPATRTLTRMIRMQGGDIDVMAHSQGTIIASEAFGQAMYRQKLDKDGQRTGQRVDIEHAHFDSLGNAAWTIPPGLHHRGIAHSNDLIYRPLGGNHPGLRVTKGAGTGFEPHSLDSEGEGNDYLDEYAKAAGYDEKTGRRTTPTSEFAYVRAGSRASNTVGEAGRWTVEQAGRAGNFAGRMIGKAGYWGQRGATYIGNAVQEGVGVAGDALSWGVGVAGDVAQNAVGLGADRTVGGAQGATRLTAAIGHGAVTVGGGIANALGELAARAVGGVDGESGRRVREAVRGNVGAAEEWAHKIIGRAHGAVNDFTSNTIGAAAHLLQNVVGAATRMTQNVIGGATHLTQQAVGTATDVARTGIGLATKGLRGGVEAAAHVVQEVLGLATRVTQDAVTMGSSIGRSVWDGTKSVASSVWDGTKSVASSVWDGTKSLASDVAERGKEAGRSAWNGAKGIAKRVGGWLQWSTLPGGSSGDVSAVPDTLLASRINAPLLRENLLYADGLGQSVPDTMRQEFVPILGFDPSLARIHTGPGAQRAAMALNAEAFTIGRDVFFASGRYDPNSAVGRGLLAHELTHVGQQTGAGAGATDDGGGEGGSGSGGGGESFQFLDSTSGDPLEAAARAIGLLVARGSHKPSVFAVGQNPVRGGGGAAMGIGGGGGMEIGQFVARYVCDPAGDALSPADRRRLAYIETRVHAEAEQRLSSAAMGGGGFSGDIGGLHLSLSLDLDTMDDDTAVAVWVNAVVRAATAAAGRSWSGADGSGLFGAMSAVGGGLGSRAGAAM